LQKPDTISKAAINRNPLYVIQEGIVIDKATGQPVANAKIRFVIKMMFHRFTALLKTEN